MEVVQDLKHSTTLRSRYAAPVLHFCKFRRTSSHQDCKDGWRRCSGHVWMRFRQQARSDPASNRMLWFEDNLNQPLSGNKLPNDFGLVVPARSRSDSEIRFGMFVLLRCRTCLVLYGFRTITLLM